MDYDIIFLRQRIERSVGLRQKLRYLLMKRKVMFIGSKQEEDLS